ncbi:hypothetical protein LXL04_033386 [Taraxacum kok-saghyz]
MRRYNKKDSSNRRGSSSSQQNEDNPPQQEGYRPTFYVFFIFFNEICHFILPLANFTYHSMTQSLPKANYPKSQKHVRAYVAEFDSTNFTYHSFRFCLALSFDYELSLSRFHGLSMVVTVKLEENEGKKRKNFGSGRKPKYLKTGRSGRRTASGNRIGIVYRWQRTRSGGGQRQSLPAANSRGVGKPLFTFGKLYLPLHHKSLPATNSPKSENILRVAYVAQFASVKFTYYTDQSKKLLKVTKKQEKYKIQKIQILWKQTTHQTQLYDLAVSLLPGLVVKEVDLLCVAIEPALKDPESCIQKKAYKVLSTILEDFKLVRILSSSLQQKEAERRAKPDEIANRRRKREQDPEEIKRLRN